MSEPSKVAEPATPPAVLLDSEQAAKIGRSMEESFREDLETLKMSDSDLEALEEKVSKQSPSQIVATLVRSWAQGRRADGQVAKLTGIRQKLLTALEYCVCLKIHVPRSLRQTFVSVSETAPWLNKTLVLCRDMSAVWWASCPSCKHALLDHRSIGGCTAPNCSCTDRGHDGLTTEELGRL